MLELKFKRLTDTMKVPTKAHETDACWDLYADIPNATYDNGDIVEKHGLNYST